MHYVHTPRKEIYKELEGETLTIVPEKCLSCEQGNLQRGRWCVSELQSSLTPSLLPSSPHTPTPSSCTVSMSSVSFIVRRSLSLIPVGASAISCSSSGSGSSEESWSSPCVRGREGEGQDEGIKEWRG